MASAELAVKHIMLIYLFVDKTFRNRVCLKKLLLNMDKIMFYYEL